MPTRRRWAHRPCVRACGCWLCACVCLRVCSGVRGKGGGGGGHIHLTQQDARGDHSQCGSLRGRSHSAAHWWCFGSLKSTGTATAMRRLVKCDCPHSFVEAVLDALRAEERKRQKARRSALTWHWPGTGTGPPLALARHWHWPVALRFARCAVRMIAPTLASASPARHAPQCVACQRPRLFVCLRRARARHAQWQSTRRRCVRSRTLR